MLNTAYESTRRSAGTRIPRGKHCFAAILLTALIVLSGVSAAETSAAESSPEVIAAEPVRLSMDAFGAGVEIEVRGLPRGEAEPAIRRALQEIHQIAGLTDASQATPGGVGFLNAAAGAGQQTIDPRLLDLLLGSLRYCLWSSNAHGPLGGELYRLWDSPSGAIPQPSDLRQATAHADCGLLQFGGTNDQRTVGLPQGPRLELRGFERGFAVDRAADILRQAGARNFWIEIGNVYFAAGGGVDGDGWLLSIPAQPDAEDEEMLKLQDQALAVASLYGIGDEAPVRWIDHRTGVPSRGVLTQITVAQNAFDAEMVATSLFIIGLRDGQRRLGSLEPRPSILWLLGDNGGGEPLVSTYRWSEVKRLKKVYQ